MRKGPGYGNPNSKDLAWAQLRTVCWSGAYGRATEASPSPPDCPQHRPFGHQWDSSHRTAAHPETGPTARAATAFPSSLAYRLNWPWPPPSTEAAGCHDAVKPDEYCPSATSALRGTVSVLPVFGLIQRELRAPFALEMATVDAKVSQQGAPFHRIVTVSRIASWGTPRNPSSRRSSRISAMASAKLSRA